MAQAGVYRVRSNQVAACAVLVLATVAACQAAATPAPLTSEEAASIVAIDRILNSTQSVQEDAIVINAHGSVVEACMQALGWDFEVGTATADTTRSPSSLSRFERWTFSDVEAARERGFDLRAYLQELAAFQARMDATAGSAHIPDPDRLSSEERARLQLEYFGRDDERIEII
jgi:hypothetical protein